MGSDLYLDQQRFELSFVLLNAGDSYLEQFLNEHRIPIRRIRVASKRDWPGAWWQLYRYLKKLAQDIVHCHLFAASILG